MFQSFVIGNLGSDAEVKTANGRQFVTLSIAHSVKFTDQRGQEQTTSVWVDAIMNDPNAKVIQYLKRGVKVAVYGDTSLRVYSSKKDRMMKAGVTIHVRSIELVGGSSDDVPRQLIVPETAQVVDVTKHYWVNADTSAMKKNDVAVLVDQRGNQYQMNKAGFVTPIVPDEGQQGDAQQPVDEEGGQ